MGEGFFKQKNGLLAVDIAAACGVFTAEQFAGLARLAGKTGARHLKLTTRQTVLVLLPEERAGELAAGLAGLGLKVAPFGNVVRPVKACPGNESLCPRTLGDALELGITLQERFLGRQVPKDFKIAVAGCPRGCTDPFCADFGVIAAGKGVFDVSIGGLAGSQHPRHGDIIARRVPEDKVPDLLEFILERFRELGQPREKLGRAVERLGLQAFLPPADMLASPKDDSALDEFTRFLHSEN
ncbi:MAG TPA: nitrite reductase [Desulfotomaculum sp.]|nr:nitrite reductase [Desulfotomaculum sp.]